MDIPNSVNSQITDAVTQANVKVLGDAPAVAMSGLYQALDRSGAATAKAMGGPILDAVDSGDGCGNNRSTKGPEDSL